MARPLRIEFKGAFYHIVQRGIEKREIFSSDADRLKFLSYLEGAFLAYKTVVHAFVLMDNHYHVILQTLEANLSKAMHYVNTSYAAYYNAKHERTGHLYQGRFKAIIVDKDEYLNHLSCYIHLNPVRAGIVKFPEQYRHSSYRYFVSDDKAPKWLSPGLILSTFSEKPDKAKIMYRQFVLDKIGKEKEIIERSMKKGIVLGSDKFFEDIKNRIDLDKNDEEIPLLRRMRIGEDISLKKVKEISEKILGDKNRLVRSVSIYLSRKYTSCTNKEIAGFYGKIGYTGISQTHRRINKARKEDKDLDKRIGRVEKEIGKVKNEDATP